MLVACWIGFPAGAGQHFLLDTGTLCVLGYYREIPAVRVWNGPLLGQRRSAAEGLVRKTRSGLKGG
jgi:hypothetical protein